ncbi:MAG TPA: glutathione S-transferase family protein, partial [Nevskiaceae bacterium]|nr:glutathione S-transferase family protein [Nevskiaceae bacterium]
DGDTLIADSHSIIDHLARTRGKDLDAHLSARERAQALAWERLLAEHLYWSMVYFRWVDDSGWQRIRKYFFSPIPAPVRPLVEFAARRGTRAQTRGHGLGRHAPQEIVRRAGEDIDALAAQLGEQPFLVGAQPTRLDATAYALLANIWQIDFDTPLKPLVARHANLRAYCERMRARCFPEPTS